MRQRRRWSYGTVEVVAKHARAMLDPTTGRIGLIGLPWTLLSQVLLPVGGPLADAFLVYLVVVGNFGMAARILALALALDMFMVVGAVLAEREDARLLFWAPFLRLVWRPLQRPALGPWGRRALASDRALQQCRDGGGARSRSVRPLGPVRARRGRAPARRSSKS